MKNQDFCVCEHPAQQKRSRGVEKISGPILKLWRKSKKRMILIVIFTVSIFNTRKNIVILTFYFYVKKIIPSP